ncbi:MAG: ATP-dependent endonuclease, partial [Muribaculaceae bacterium]|nr:ATP-dependent endonuclease [Muribaculaceae bacterium]
MNLPPIADRIFQFLPFSPHPLQVKLVALLADFITTRPHNGVFIINGYAGSGKTSVVGALIK